MKMMFLLVSAVALLVNPAFAKSTRHRSEYNLNSIIDLAKQYNESVTKPQEIFVDDVSHLAEGSGKCEDKFFCKVHEILDKHEGLDVIVIAIARNLNASQNFECKEIQKEMNSTGITIQIPKLLEHLTTCIRHRNFVGGKTSSP